MTTQTHNDPHSALIKYHRPTHSYHPYPPPGFMAHPIATYHHGPIFNPVGANPSASMTSQSSVVMTSQQQLQNYGTNFCIDNLIGKEASYNGEPSSPQHPQQQVTAVSHGVSPAHQDNSITSSSSNGAYNVNMTSVQQSQFAQQYHDNVMTSQHQLYSHQMGNSQNQSHLNTVHHQGQQQRYMQAGFYGEVGADFATLQPPTHVECY